jgi:hypothetical protein
VVIHDLVLLMDGFVESRVKGTVCDKGTVTKKKSDKTYNDHSR